MVKTQYLDEKIVADTTSTFTLVTYNLLYSSMSETPSDWEEELVAKTMGPKNKPEPYTVAKKNVKWNTRYPRLIENMKINGTIPDILLFQETTPNMIEFLLNKLGVSQEYAFVKSKYGCCGTPMRGYCYVCWKKSVFGAHPKTFHSQHPFCRFVGVYLTFQGRECLVCSTHLPADGRKRGYCTIHKPS